MKALPRAVLDACVLYPMYLRDTLLRCAEAGFFTPVWSATILDELARALRRQQVRANVARITRLMRDAFPEASVRTRGVLPDEVVAHAADRHVMQTALGARADFLVTQNTRHFDGPACRALGVDVVKPDSFLCVLLDTHPETMLTVLVRQAAAYDRPKMTPHDLAGVLRPQVPAFAERVGRYS